ncbi:MAG: polyhydroxyalkanoic acid system family protein [Gammaproteobacteria bacterium]
MATIKIKKEHALPHDKVVKAVQKLADELAEKLDADYEWEGDDLSFKRSGASGKVCVGKENVEVDIKLGMLLTPLKGKIEQTVRDYLDEILV